MSPSASWPVAPRPQGPPEALGRVKSAKQSWENARHLHLETRSDHELAMPPKKHLVKLQKPVSPDFGTTEKPLEGLMDRSNQLQFRHDSMKNALVEAREAKSTTNQKSALESDLEIVSQSLEKESESISKLKMENKFLRDKLAAKEKDSDSLAHMPAASIQLRKENAALKAELQEAKGEHQSHRARRISL